MVSAVPLRDFHLPQLSEQPRTETRHHDGIDIEHAQLQPAELGAALGAARGAAATLRRCSTSAVLARLDAFVELWADEAYAPRRLAERTLPSVTGFSPETIRHGLPALLEPLRGGAIGALLGEELGSVRFLDEVYRGCRAHLPSLMTHVLSGNIPGLAATAMLLSLAMRGAVLVKSAVGDPLFPAMFASSLAEEDAELGSCVVVAHWRGLPSRVAISCPHPAATRPSLRWRRAFAVVSPATGTKSASRLWAGGACRICAARSTGPTGLPTTPRSGISKAACPRNSATWKTAHG
jgi:hypothetical protein